MTLQSLPRRAHAGVLDVAFGVEDRLGQGGDQAGAVGSVGGDDVLLLPDVGLAVPSADGEVAEAEQEGEEGESAARPGRSRTRTRTRREAREVREGARRVMLTRRAGRAREACSGSTWRTPRGSRSRRRATPRDTGCPQSRDATCSARARHCAGRSARGPVATRRVVYFYFEGIFAHAGSGGGGAGATSPRRTPSSFGTPDGARRRDDALAGRPRLRSRSRRPQPRVRPVASSTSRRCATTPTGHRRLTRLLTRESTLWSEMEKARAILRAADTSDRKLSRLLRRGSPGGREVLQLGGDDPDAVGAAAALALDFDYPEINLPTADARRRNRRRRLRRVAHARPLTRRRRHRRHPPRRGPAAFQSPSSAASASPRLQTAARSMRPSGIRGGAAAPFVFVLACVDAGARGVVAHCRGLISLAGLSPRANRDAPHASTGTRRRGCARELRARRTDRRTDRTSRTFRTSRTSRTSPFPSSSPSPFP